MTHRLVVVVDDCPQAASTLEIALGSMAGVEVAVASTVPAALEILRNRAEGSVAALLTDLDLPRMDGFDLIEKVRSDPRYVRLPIIVISGSTDPDVPARSMRLGASAYFAKPYSPGEVRNQLERLLHANPI